MKILDERLLSVMLTSHEHDSLLSVDISGLFLDYLSLIAFLNPNNVERAQNTTLRNPPV